ncbi:RlpA-like double-psi beta-barrel-protein domain-containing protein-containing protein, partial [Mycena capillaripes]
FFQPGLGACGTTNTADQLIVAVGHGKFDTFPGAGPNPNANPICGKKIKATSGGKSVTVTVVDRCAGCAGAADLDFSQAAFAKLAAPAVGRIHRVKWEFV